MFFACRALWLLLRCKKTEYDFGSGLMLGEFQLE